MSLYQSELNFETSILSNQTLNDKQHKCNVLKDYDISEKPYYRINKYMDLLCNRVPYCIGWGVWSKLCDIRLWIKSNYQKLRCGVSDKECWNLNETFAHYILPRLKHFREMHRMGIPSSMFTKYHPINNDEESKAVKFWNYTLDEMIWTFEYILDNEKFNPIPDIPNKKDVSTKTNNEDCVLNYLFKERTDEDKILWNNYFKKQAVLEERRNKGLLLFAENFNNLWD